MAEELEQALCADAVPGVRGNPMAESGESDKREVKGCQNCTQQRQIPKWLDKRLTAAKQRCENPNDQGYKNYGARGIKFDFPSVTEAGLYLIQEFRFPDRNMELDRIDTNGNYAPGNLRFVDHKNELNATRDGIRAEPIRSAVLAICPDSGQEAVAGTDEGSRLSGCREGSLRETKELERHQGKVRVYDIRNAGRHHRFTVSGKFVHNCGYGGGVGALKAMGAEEMGLTDEELSNLVRDWRIASPNIVRLWWAVDKAAKNAVKEKTTTRTHGLSFQYQGGMLYITLPSGRQLSYVSPRIGENRFGEGKRYLHGYRHDQALDPDRIIRPKVR